MGEVSKYTDFLYARPSFLEGLARVVDFGNILQEYNTTSIGDADERAIRADWLAVGDDIYEVLEKLNKNTDERQRRKREATRKEECFGSR